MGWTKQELINEALGEIALQGFNINLGSDVLQLGLRRLDVMMAAWDGKCIRLGYPLPSSPSASSLDQQSGIPDYAYEAVVSNLACRLASGFGKVLTPDTRALAKSGYNLLLSKATFPPQQQFTDRLPRGAGNKPWRDESGPWMPVAEDPLEAGQDGEIEFD